MTDSGTGLATTYFYDFTDRLMKYTEESGSYSHTVDYLYDDKGNLTQLFDTIGGAIYKSYYTYDADNRITKVKDGRVSEEYAYDAYGRTTTRTAKYYTDTVLTESFTYKSRNSTHAGNLVNTATNTAANFNVTYSYTYNGRWDILSVNDGSYKTTYTYGTESQLIRENNPRAGKTWVWTYDDAGNILTRTEYAYTTGTVGTPLDTVVYTYGDSGWGDLLTAYDGQTITYDGIGNPLTDGTWTYTWEHGRQLAGMSGTDIGGEANDVSVSYTYNADGLRTSKTVTTKVYHTHSYTSTVVAPTCTSTGYTLHTCDCGDSYQDSETEMLPHSYTSTTVEPTCTEDGYTSYVCACGASYQETIGALGHDYEMTHSDDLYTYYTCIRCGATCRENIGVLPPQPTEPGLEIMSEEEVETSNEESAEVSLEAEAGEDAAASGETAEVMAASSTEDRVLESTIVQTYTYYYNGDLLRYVLVDGCSLYFVYDANGKPLTVTYRDGTSSYFCYYVTNPQGDVTAILDSTGTAVVQYYYDAWGNILSTTGSMADTLGEYNPLRYRSYVYDTETGLYYLQSRYYNPEVGRFINADGYVSTGQGVLGSNMFAYCGNNPVNLSDINGTYAASIFNDDLLIQRMRESCAGNTSSSAWGGVVAVTTTLTLVADIVSNATNKEREQAAAIVVASDSKHQEFFPENPFEFVPNGLIMHVYVDVNAKGNGGIIKWEIPGTKIAVFEWNQDYTYGPHYHVLMPEWKNKHLDSYHYKAGEPVPEPWNTMFFGS